MRMRAMGSKYIAAMIVASALLMSSAALACSCRTPDLALSIADADVVLVAKVLTFKPLDQVTLSPKEVFKGTASKVFTIQTGQSDCDYFLPPIAPTAGDTFLLFLRQSEGRLTASRCLTSGPVAEKAADLRALRRQFPSRARPGAAVDPNPNLARARSSPFHALLRHSCPVGRTDQGFAASCTEQIHA